MYSAIHEATEAPEKKSIRRENSYLLKTEISSNVSEDYRFTVSKSNVSRQTVHNPHHRRRV